MALSLGGKILPHDKGRVQFCMSGKQVTLSFLILISLSLQVLFRSTCLLTLGTYILQDLVVESTEVRRERACHNKTAETK